MNWEPIKTAPQDNTPVLVIEADLASLRGKVCDRQISAWLGSGRLRRALSETNALDATTPVTVHLR